MNTRRSASEEESREAPRLNDAQFWSRVSKTPLWLKFMLMVYYANFVLIFGCIIAFFQAPRLGEAKYLLLATVTLGVFAYFWRRLLTYVTNGRPRPRDAAPPTTLQTPNSPAFAVPRTWPLAFQFGHFHEALSRSNLKGFFREETSIWPATWAVELFRATGQNAKGEKTWSPVGTFHGERGRPGYLEAAKFLEAALNAGLLIPQWNADGRPIVRLRLELSECGRP